ncbi:MAG: hypothetical protein D3925_18850, partial [Candidatus Electrothrix sp. AR5]|nr:hypothetical protein [Candidatus Electrothrix sp. AR5]
MKYIRSLYAVTLIAFLSLFVFTQIKIYLDLDRKIREDLQDYNNIFAAAAHSTLHEAELLLDMLGNQLLTEQAYKNLQTSHQVMARMMERFPFVAGFGLTDQNGNFIVTSANINPADAKGLRESDITRPSFDLTLTSDTMVVGQVYYHPPTEKWVIPLRKALRDASGNIIGVMATGISLESSLARGKTSGQTARFLENTHILPDQLSLLIHDVLMYRIYVYPLPHEKYSDLYSRPISQATYEAALRQGMESLGKTEDELKQQELSFFHQNTSDVINSTSLFVSQFSSRYKLRSSTPRPDT